MIHANAVNYESGKYLRPAGQPCESDGGDDKLTELRLMYEPYVCAGSKMLLIDLPPWIVSSEAIDNCKTSAGDEIQYCC